MESNVVPDELIEELFPEDNELGEDMLFSSKCKKISGWGI